MYRVVWMNQQLNYNSNATVDDGSCEYDKFLYLSHISAGDGEVTRSLILIHVLLR